uniref:Uncharacterized protein n=1 Tax=Oryza sativa subsp. japonica TaxID=39947 RepID=Q654R1_ORYSJ|nr:hypothetical protein [Oryza sativa Japonica Group]BAD52614.1 hypothetical protein [Oryza sativa Japonica Group]
MEPEIEFLLVARDIYPLDPRSQIVEPPQLMERWATGFSGHLDGYKEDSDVLEEEKEETAAP